MTHTSLYESFSGGDGGDRTHDLLTASQTLSRIIGEAPPKSREGVCASASATRIKNWQKQFKVEIVISLLWLDLRSVGFQGLPLCTLLLQAVDAVQELLYVDVKLDVQLVIAADGHPLDDVRTDHFLRCAVAFVEDF